MKLFSSKNKKLRKPRITAVWRIKLKRWNQVILKREKRVRENLKCINRQWRRKKLHLIKSIKKRHRIWRWTSKKWERSLMADVKNSKDNWQHIRIIMKQLKLWRKHMRKRLLHMYKNIIGSTMNSYSKKWTVKMH